MMFKTYLLIDNSNVGEKNRDWKNPSAENGTAAAIEEKRDAQICNDLGDPLSLIPHWSIRENTSLQSTYLTNPSGSAFLVAQLILPRQAPVSCPRDSMNSLNRFKSPSTR